jgi:hypothetical protein
MNLGRVRRPCERPRPASGRFAVAAWSGIYEEERNGGGLVRWPVPILFTGSSSHLSRDCGDCLECHQSRKSRDVELLLPHENCIARLLAQTGRKTEEIS